jgi:penicillin-binding protein 2
MKENMKKIHILIILSFLLAACAPQPASQPEANPAEITTETPVANEQLPEPQVKITSVPETQEVVQKFLSAWENEAYEEMYAMLSSDSQNTVSFDDFSNHYLDAAKALTLDSLACDILTVLTSPKQAQAAYRVKYTTNLFGELFRDTQMNLSLDNGVWKINWASTMIMPELTEGNYLSLDVKLPSRGNIYDFEGDALASQANLVALGIVPGQIEDEEGQLLAELSRLTGLTQTEIYELYRFAQPDWYIPVGTVTEEEINDRYNVLASLGGLVIFPYTARYYPEEGVASHVTGYVQPIPADQLDDYLRRGYRGDERVGVFGLENWGEKYLLGDRGGVLYVVDQNGQIVTRVGQKDSGPAGSIYTTFDDDLQEQIERTLLGFRGAIVVMERDTGRILAMASSPDFDPNIFDSANRNYEYMIQEFFKEEDQPLWNRAAQGTYPLGSVFKVITMAAALESGLYTTDSVYDCGHTFNELPGITLYDWTYEKEKPPSGTLTLPEGLMRSCNPWFYHLGLDLYRQMGAEYLAEMARGFGLDSRTGIGQISEAEGNITNPTTENEAVQMGIGQGDMLVSPLQVVDFIAAIGNGGTLYRPQVVEKIELLDGTLVYEFEPEVRGTLPISEETLVELQKAMLSVTDDTRGTAYREFLGLKTRIYGKTGTATNPFGESHAWFAGYTNSMREDKPNIAAVIIAENGGEGSEVGAPIFRRVLEYYYDGKASTLYPWESSFFRTQTPTPLVTETPDPNATPSP